MSDKVDSLLDLSLREIRSAIPPQLFRRSAAKSSQYLARDLCMGFLLFHLTNTALARIDSPQIATLLPLKALLAIRCLLWAFYWWFQGLIFTGIWAIGHECGHGAFSPFKGLNDSVGFIAHTALLTPYFSWKIIHHRHHMHHAAMEKDEVFVPRTRQHLGIPKESDNHPVDYEQYLGDSPLYTLFILIRQQMIAFPVYMMTNASGQPLYPDGTNHFNPNALFFAKGQRLLVLISNIGIASTLALLLMAARHFGSRQIFMYYVVPYLLLNHWIVMITYLQHTDLEIPHYRKGWTFTRGAAATIDRNILGWQGRFFLHDVGHHHVVHHFFPKLPWYNGEEATKYLRTKIGPHYAFRDEPSFKALWRTYNSCQFVEDEGDIVFYKDRSGRSKRQDVVLI